MASALKLPPLTPRSQIAASVGHAELPTTRSNFGHRATSATANGGRFQSVRTARAQGEVYIHEHDHGMLSPHPSTSTLTTPRALQRGEVGGRRNAALRVAEYRAKHPFAVREPQPERVPAVRLWMLSDDFRKQSPRRKRISPGSRAPFIGPLLTSTSQVFTGAAPV